MKPISRKKRIEAFLIEETKSILKKSGENLVLGISTGEITKQLSLTRSNVSKELNNLFKEKKVLKISGKPVLYLSVNQLKGILEEGKKEDYVFTNDELSALIENSKTNLAQSDIFSTMIGADGSLKNIIEELKSAIVYPPNGLNILLTGETGVGKTTMVEYLYRYAIEENVLSADAPLIQFNCADYADNPQLIMSLLFGFEKGAFTGAQEKQIGLVKQAENGILFLDEVHRLSPQAQEMLFQVMDQQSFRSLGNTKAVSIERILFVMATTEDISSYLLKTFTRRIPVIVKIPGIEERYPSEKFDYINLFLQEEAERIHLPLLVSKEIITAFLTYKTTGNLGQLKVDIKLTCAKAYMKNRKNLNQNLVLEFNNLPDSVVHSYFDSKNETDVLKKDLISRIEKIVKITEKNFKNSTDDSSSLTRWSNNNSINYNQYQHNPFNEIEQAYSTAKNLYSQVDTFEAFNNSQLITKIIDYSVFHAVKTILNELNLTLKKNTILGLMLHINTIKNKIFSKNVTKYNTDPSIEERYPEEYQLAVKIRKRLNELLDFYIPRGEIAFLTMLLHISKEEPKSTIGILVLSHGKVATEMCHVVNSFLNTTHAIAIDLPLDGAIDEIYQFTLTKIDEIDQGKGVLILSDMGSLALIENLIQNKTHHSISGVNPVSMPMLLEATRKALLPNSNLTELTQMLKQTFLPIDGNPLNIQIDNKRMEDSLREFLLFLDPQKVILILDTILTNIITDQNYQGDRDGLRIKFIFHSASMIERVMMDDFLPYKNLAELIKEQNILFNLIKKQFKAVEEQYFIQIPDTELAYIVEIFNTHFSIDISEQE